METEIETRVCPRCKKPMVFQEICESNPGEIKSMWSCELCGVLVYIIAFIE